MIDDDEPMTRRDVMELVREEIESSRRALGLALTPDEARVVIRALRVFINQTHPHDTDADSARAIIHRLAGWRTEHST